MNDDDDMIFAHLFLSFSITSRRASHIPRSKATLRNCLSRHRCREFRAGQNLHNYYFPEWLEDDYNRTLTPVKCFVKDKQEPYVGAIF